MVDFTRPCCFFSSDALLSKLITNSQLINFRPKMNKIRCFFRVYVCSLLSKLLPEHYTLLLWQLSSMFGYICTHYYSETYRSASKLNENLIISK